MGGVIFGLVVIGFGLMIWFIRLCRRMRAEYRPPFGLAGPFEFLRLDYYSDTGRILIARAASILAVQSLVLVAASLLIAKLSPWTHPLRPGAAAPPPDFLFSLTSAVFFSAASLACLVLLLAAALQFGWTLLKQSAQPLRLNAARYALYGVGAFVLAAAHQTLLKIGPGLLK
jgi:hypothetical protein